MKFLYKYPQRAFPYLQLVEENRRRGKNEPEFELIDTGAFDDDRYFDVVVEYAKKSSEEILIRITAHNRGPEAADLHILPTIWFRNRWSWNPGRKRPALQAEKGTPGAVAIRAEEEHYGRRWLICEGSPELLFTENETNNQRLFGVPNRTPYVKDGINSYIVNGSRDAVNLEQTGTKASALYRIRVEAGSSTTVRLRLTDQENLARVIVASDPSNERNLKSLGAAAATSTAVTEDCFGPAFDHVFAQRIAEADDFYAKRIPKALSKDAQAVQRQAFAGLLWSKQFYHYDVNAWLQGDPAGPTPPDGHRHGRNHEWTHLYNADVISMPDKWEYPWYAAWDLAFHSIPLAQIDPDFAKEQLTLMLREWYMHPNGQLPAYEFAFGDVNPPVHAWACWRVYKMTGTHGQRDRPFLSRTFQKLLLNFTWWVNRKDAEGKNLFSGGFLGLDNIGVFDRSKPLPTGGHLEQADGTAWMAFFCNTMLSMALELSRENPATEDMASKFFEHFIAIADAINTQGGMGLWDEDDGFYYDQLHLDGRSVPLKVRSLVGLIPLLAVEILEDEIINKLPGFRKRMDWFLKHRKDLADHIAYMECAAA